MELKQPSRLEGDRHQTSANSSNNLEILTFTGLDSRVDLNTIWDISERYPRVEFGVLVGSRSGRDNRYPSLEEVSWWGTLGKKSGKALALHLCGRFARAAVDQQKESDGDITKNDVLGLCSGFRRVQINIGKFESQAVADFAERVDSENVILQKRESFEVGQSLIDPKVEYLFDVSGGRGVGSFDFWEPPALGEGRSGYAGGLNLANINQALEFVNSIPHHRVWLDMESGVRTVNDWLDTNQVKAICQTTFGY